MRHRARHLPVLVLAGCAAALALAAEAAAATTPVSGTLLAHLPRNASQPFPCPGPGICGAGTLRGLGAVQITIDDEELTPIPGSDCFSDQRTETIGVLDGSGTIALDSVGSVCTPGASGGAPASFMSFGNPVFFSLTFTIDGVDSTGAYHGAAGSGTEGFQFAGATAVWTVAGTITTP